MVLVCIVMLIGVLNRTIVEVNVQRDRNPPFVQLQDGGVRNGYTFKILNKLHEPRTFRISVEGLPDARLSIVGQDKLDVTVATDNLRELRAFVTVPPGSLGKLAGRDVGFNIVVEDQASGQKAYRNTIFISGN